MDSWLIILLHDRLIISRGVELESTIQLKSKDSGDEKVKQRFQVKIWTFSVNAKLCLETFVLQENENKRSVINNEALAFALAYTNAMFLASSVVMSFFLLRYFATSLSCFQLCVHYLGMHDELLAGRNLRKWITRSARLVRASSSFTSRLSKENEQFLWASK